MEEILLHLLALFFGGILGFLFFGGLWFTVRKAMESKVPALWFFSSILLRMGAVLIGFYWVVQSTHWINVLVCLLGFVLARLMVVQLTKAYDLRRLEPKMKGDHEA